MTTPRTAFVLPVPWDRATIALERAIGQGRVRFSVLDRSNGYWHLRAGGVNLHVELRIQSPTATHISVVARPRRLGLLQSGRDAEDVLRTVRQDIERSLDANAA